MTSIKILATAVLFSGSLLAFGQNCAGKTEASGKRITAKERTNELTSNLSFTPEQAKKAEAIFLSTEKAVQAMTGKEDATAMAKLEAREKDQLIGLMDEKQAQKFNELCTNGKFTGSNGCAGAKGGARPACCAGGRSAEVSKDGTTHTASPAATPTPAAH